MPAFDAWLQRSSTAPRQPGRPLVSLCYAQSLDGSLTVQRGQPTELSGPESRRLTHRLRAAHDAILVGVGTVLADNPRLTVRLVQGTDPQPVILDSRLRTPVEAYLTSEHPCPAWIATTSRADPLQAAALHATGVRLITLPADPQGQVNLPDLLDCLGEMGVRRLMVEGGARVITSFLTQGLVDRAIITIAPRFLGGLPVVEMRGNGLDGLRLPQLAETRVELLGSDVLIYGAVDI